MRAAPARPRFGAAALDRMRTRLRSALRSLSRSSGEDGRRRAPQGARPEAAPSQPVQPPRTESSLKPSVLTAGRENSRGSVVFRRLAWAPGDVRRVLSTGVAFLGHQQDVYTIDVPPREFRDHFTFDAFCDTFQDSLVWLSGQVLLSFDAGDAAELSVTAFRRTLAFCATEEARREELVAAVDGVLGLLAAHDGLNCRLNPMKTVTFLLRRPRHTRLLPATAAALAALAEGNDQIHGLTFRQTELSEEHCAALGAMRPRHSRLRLELDGCRLASPEALARGLAGDGGPAELVCLTAGATAGALLEPLLPSLARNARLRDLSVSATPDPVAALTPEVVPRIAAALAANRGLVSLTLNGNLATDDGFRRLCGALSLHPRLEKLKFLLAWDPMGMMFGRPPVLGDVRMQALADLVQTNTRIESLQIDRLSQEHPLWLLIQRTLRHNAFAKRLAELPQIEDEPYRQAVMARLLRTVAAGGEPRLLHQALTTSAVGALLMHA